MCGWGGVGAHACDWILIIVSVLGFLLRAHLLAVIHKKFIHNYCLYLICSYFGTPMMPYWRHLYKDVETLIAKTNYTNIKQVKIVFLHSVTLKNNKT